MWDEFTGHVRALVSCASLCSEIIGSTLMLHIIAGLYLVWFTRSLRLPLRWKCSDLHNVGFILTHWSWIGSGRCHFYVVKSPFLLTWRFSILNVYSLEVITKHIIGLLNTWKWYLRKGPSLKIYKFKSHCKILHEKKSLYASKVIFWYEM